MFCSRFLKFVMQVISQHDYFSTVVSHYKHTNKTPQKVTMSKVHPSLSIFVPPCQMFAFAYQNSPQASRNNIGIQNSPIKPF